MDLMDKFERNVKIMMAEKGYNQLSLAKKLGLGKTTVNSWLTSHKEPTLSNIYKLTKALDCTFEELIDKKN